MTLLEKLEQYSKEERPSNGLRLTSIRVGAVVMERLLQNVSDLTGVRLHRQSTLRYRNLNIEVVEGIGTHVIQAVWVDEIDGHL